MKRKTEEFGESRMRMFPELHFPAGYYDENSPRVLSRTVTFQVTDACNLACKYCYQINKGKRRMSLDTAKKFVDYLLDADESNEYINSVISPFIILEFIGGDPLMEIELIDQTMDYFIDQAFMKEHPWATRYVISLCSNGVLYFDEKVQKFFNKHQGHVSLNITIDGNKELHDSCRVFPDGRPSYDIAVAAAQDWMNVRKGYMGSKITIAPENLTYLYDALVHMIGLGYKDINANCVFEEGWELHHAQEFYRQLKRFADYLIENDINDIDCSLFVSDNFSPMSPDDNDNWCWGRGTPILTKDGYVPIENIKIGDLVYTHDGTLKPVINTMSHFADNVVNISVAGKEFVCTDNHKLFATVNGKVGKFQIKEIDSDDLIMLFNDNTGSTDIIRNDDGLWIKGMTYAATDNQTVYNITVAENHSYVAGGIVSSNCGGTGAMLAMDPDGHLYPCLRYMESSIGDDQPPLRFGHVDTGIGTTDKEKEIIDDLNKITRRSQSTDECFYCPIAKGCAWCSAHNFQVFGTANKRATFICDMHKARSLANVYYWNKLYQKNSENRKMIMHCPEEWAVPIIGQEEYDYLKSISEESDK